MRPVFMTDFRRLARAAAFCLPLMAFPVLVSSGTSFAQPAPKTRPVPASPAAVGAQAGASGAATSSFARDRLQGAEGQVLPIPAEGTAPAAPPAVLGDDVAGGGQASGDRPSKSDFAYGAFQRGFYLTALAIAKPLANLGDPAAQTLLGEIYSRGLGVPQNLKEATRWYKAAAQSGNAEGQFRYALILLDGTQTAADPAKAKELMKAAADKGLPLAEFNYAQMLIEASPSGGFVDAMPYFAKAADAGVPDAQYAMAQLYEYGRGVQTDEMQARNWLGAAAIGGFPIAQIEYGIWLINGKGGPADLPTGFRFLKFAADRGNPIAINRVAHLFKDGIGTPPDRQQAAKWVLLAKRVENSDPVLDDFFRGLDETAKKTALEAANRFRSG